MSLGLGRSAPANMEHIWMSLSQPRTRNLSFLASPSELGHKPYGSWMSICNGRILKQNIQIHKSKIEQVDGADGTQLQLHNCSLWVGTWVPSLRQRAPSWQVCTRVSELVCRLQDHTKSGHNASGADSDAADAQATTRSRIQNESQKKNRLKLS